MAQDNLTCVLYGINDLRLEQRPIPEPKDDQVLLQMEVVGICGSDVHYMVEGKIGPFVVEKPMVIGHEASGTVVKCGKDVTHLKPGDHVAIEPGVPCRKCDFCKTGSYHLCPTIFFCATPPDDGNLSRYYVHAADFCFKLPPNMDLEEGALMEPLAVGCSSTKKARVQVGDKCLILGAGPIGLVTLLACKARGASVIIITDLIDIKLKRAKDLGAHHTINITGMKEDNIIAEIIKCLDGHHPNKTIDCCGVELAIRVAMKVTRTNGVVVLVGCGPPEQTLPIGDALFREVDIKGVFRYSNDYPTAIDMVSSGKIAVKSLITHHFALEEAKEAFETARTQKGDPIKILIHANPSWKSGGGGGGGGAIGYSAGSGGQGGSDGPGGGKSCPCKNR